MSRASVGTKILLVAASFTLPLTVMIWMMVNGVNGYIDFARQELRGGEYQAALERVLEAALDREAAALFCSQLTGRTEKAQATAAVDQGLPRSRRFT